MNAASLRVLALAGFAVVVGMLVFVRQSFANDRRRDLALHSWARTDVDCMASGIRAFLWRHRNLLGDLFDRDDEPFADDLPLDPWGHEYELREGPTPLSFTIVSAGPDGQFGSADDIRSPAK